MAYTTITDPSAHFQIALYTGNGGSSTQVVTNDGNSNLQPDWIWLKNRTSARWHLVNDSSRGASYNIYPNVNDVEDVGGSGGNTTITSFNSDGFTLATDTGDGGWNEQGDSEVAWQWKSNGGTTSTNSNGAVNSTVQANTTAGFSIVTWTSAGSTNVGHGLGVAPNLIIIKARNAAENWLVGSDEIVWTKRIRLNLTDASANSSAFGQAPTSSIFYCYPANASYNYVAYCFAEKQGYSKFGSYTGNGNADGAFVYTGFKPAWIMTKRTDATGAWNIQDLKRSPINVQDNFLQSNDADAEASAGGTGIWDSLSNGFKLRQNLSSTNNSGSNYIYMAFAENPLVATNGVPTTAR